ncbi:MAG: serine threonine kinase [Trebouxia sp. A1-2]|nr:MAG: serine threonine kinase [Trebouxia sp. A1-2]
MAKQDAEGSEQGRLLRDALEFNKPQSESTIKQQVGKPPAEPHFEYKAGDMLGNKYRVTEVLGRGKAGVTYKAERPGGGAVAVKALSLRTMADWKQLELFEKEADALRSLSHPGIPAYKDYFEVDSDGDRAYFLVQELIEGKSLAQMVEAGWQPAQTEVERIAGELLTTFSYLQQQQVVHRDVKPENIILEGGKPGGKLFLVDFGGIQQGSSNVADSEVMDTGTLVGTYGYMAPEQLRGSARPASDLFALGGTLLYLLSGEPPSAFPQRRLKVDFSRVEMSPRLSGLLEGLLQPAHEDRLTATQAKAVLAGQGPAKQQRQQQKAWNPFSQDGWEEARQGSRTSSSDRQAAGSNDQETASTSGRQSEPQGIGFNNVLLALAAAYVLPGPLFPLVALTLPFWLSGKSRRRSRSRSANEAEPSTSDTAESDWMSGTQRQRQRGFGFSDGPHDNSDSSSAGSENELSAEEQEALRKSRKQQQMAAFQQQQMLFNMMRMMGGGMMGGYRGGFGGPFGMRGGFRRGPFMF